jgi:hypothetical protein
MLHKARSVRRVADGIIWHYDRNIGVMATVTIKIPDDALEEAQEIADEHHDGNRSAAIRELVDKGLRYDEV